MKTYLFKPDFVCSGYSDFIVIYLVFLTLCMLGNFVWLLVIISAESSFNFFFSKIVSRIPYQYQAVCDWIQITGPMFCPAWSGSKLFAKIISRWMDRYPVCIQLLIQDNLTLIPVIVTMIHFLWYRPSDIRYIVHKSFKLS